PRAKGPAVRTVLHHPATRQRPGHDNCSSNRRGPRRADRCRGLRPTRCRDHPDVAEGSDMSEEHLRIAVADDERDIREYLQEVLPRLGHQVVVAASDGRQLVEAARSARPDLVITDIKMPGLDGIDAALALNQAGPVPVVLLSAHDDEELVRRASAEGVLAYLLKPISEADLKTTIPVAMQ